MTPLHVNPQEVFLLERYISLGYLGELRDTWAKMVAHVEACLQRFMRQLPSDYRSRNLPEQPDVVWGEHVLPNFRNTLQSLNAGFILLSHGDYNALNYCHGPSNDFRGQREFWSGWMSESERGEYFSLLGKSDTLAFNIITTNSGHWDPTDLSTRCNVEGRGLLELPNHWPAYTVSRNISVQSGRHVAKAGIYIPDIDGSCPQFLSPSHKEAPLAKVLVEIRDVFSPISGEKYDEEVVLRKEACVWYLVERTSDTSKVSSSPSTNGSKSYRTPAGLPCEEDGYYFTPARKDSRCHFKRGDLMPGFDADYGTTIWQWDENQG